MRVIAGKYRGKKLACFDYDDEDSDMNELNIDDAKAIIAYFFGEK